MKNIKTFSGYEKRIEMLKQKLFETRKELSKYEKGYNELFCYWDSISDEEKLKLHKRLTKLGL